MIEQKTVDAAIEALELAKNREPVRTYESAKEAVSAMQDHIKQLHAKGWSPKAIADVIREAGIPATVSTVRGVLSDKPRRTRRKKTATTTTENPAPATAEAVAGLPLESGNNFNPAS